MLAIVWWGGAEYRLTHLWRDPCQGGSGRVYSAVGWWSSSPSASVGVSGVPSWPVRRWSCEPLVSSEP